MSSWECHTGTLGLWGLGGTGAARDLVVPECMKMYCFPRFLHSHIRMTTESVSKPNMVRLVFHSIMSFIKIKSRWTW